jgi:1-acyl-sn-glycerol-3-phosphate acyltransferase
VLFWLRLAAIAAGLIVCVPLHYLWKLLRLRSIWPQVFLAYVGRCAGMRVRIEGAPLKSHVLFAANHVSWLDILALGGAAPAVFVARHDVEQWPMIGWLAGINDTIYVARHARGEVQEQAGELRRALADGRALALFAEGTTNGGPVLLPFRASLFASLYPPVGGVRVQPVAIDYGPLAEEIAWVGDEGPGANARRVMSRKGSFVATLRFLDPIDPAEAGNRKLLAARARDAVGTALGRLDSASEAAADPL